MEWINDALALLLLGVGTLLGLAAKKRRFDRTNVFGVECFPSFAARFWSRLTDELLKKG